MRRPGDGAGFAYVLVAEELLRSALHYPENAHVVACEVARPGVLRLLFHSPDLPDRSGESIPEVQPYVTAVHQQAGVDRAPEFVWSWGIEP